MKTINVTFTCEEYERLLLAKKSNGDLNWHDFILKMSEQMEATE